MHHARSDLLRSNDEARQAPRQTSAPPCGSAPHLARSERIEKRAHPSIDQPRRSVSRPMRPGTVSPSARAAKVSAMRCLSTGSASAATSSRDGDETAVDERAGAGRQHQRLRSARARTPGDMFGDRRIALARTRARERDRGSPRRRSRRPAGAARGAASRSAHPPSWRACGFVSLSPVVSMRMRRSASRSG